MLLQESLYEGVLFSCCFLVGEVSVCPLCEVVFKRCPERGMLVVSGLAGVFNDVVGFGCCFVVVFPLNSNACILFVVVSHFFCPFLQLLVTTVN